MRARPGFLLAVMVALVPAAGCGLKGPLYIPTAQQLKDEADRVRELEERDRLEREAAEAPPPTVSSPPAAGAAAKPAGTGPAMPPPPSSTTAPAAQGTTTTP